MDKFITCECSDPGCPCCGGICHNTATTTLYRIDMTDYTGTDLCEDCASDCMDSGLFGTEQNFYSQ